MIRGTGKNWKNRPSDSQTFSGKEFYEHLLILRKTLTSQTAFWSWSSWPAPLLYPEAFLHLLIFGPYIFNLIKFLSSRMQQINHQVVVRQEYHSANIQTMLEQAALSSCGLSPPSVNAPQGPQVILPLRSYTGDHPSDRKAQGRPPATS